MALDSGKQDIDLPANDTLDSDPQSQGTALLVTIVVLVILYLISK